MKTLLVAIAALCLAACSTNGDRSALDRIEFDDGEYGCARITGQVDLDPGLIGSSTATVVVVKVKPAPEGQSGDIPTC